MQNWWKVGFISLLLTTTVAFTTHLVIREPNQNLATPSEVVDFTTPESLSWDWSDGFECNIYELCQVIDVFDTASCEDQILVPVEIEDDHERWIASYSTVISSPKKQGVASIEIGFDQLEFEYLVIGELSCTAMVPTVKAEI